MRDPFPIPPPAALVRFVQPLGESLALPTLGLHAHEVTLSIILYTTICTIVSPALSSTLCPRTYHKLSRRTKLNWDVHVVSFFQSILICAMSFYVMFYDEDRKELHETARHEARIWEYTGMTGLLQSFALGYFIWDFILCAWHVEIFGWGMLAHAVSALSVFALGYRPFVYYYAPNFLLYELSSPFLNIHWFCDKLDLTGSTLQAVNGAFLTSSFFAARLVWGNISSLWVFTDVFFAFWKGRTSMSKLDTGAPKNFTVAELMDIYNDGQMQRFAFKGDSSLPTWLVSVYVASNLTLNCLNFFWFGKMIETIRKRFDPPFGTKGLGSDKVHYEPEEKVETAAGQHSNATPSKPKGSVKAARERAEAVMDGPIASDEGTEIQRVVLADGSRGVEVAGQRTLRTRRKA